MATKIKAKKERVARSASVETFTVERATADYENRGKNRPVRQARLKELADVILSGNFEDNGEAIVYDWNGRLIDGQNRLGALALAGKKNPNATITSTVSYGVNPKTFWSIDQNSPRSINDVYAILGETYSRELSVASRFLWSRLYQGTVAASGKFRSDRALSLLKDHPELEDSVTFVCRTEYDDNSDNGSIAALGIAIGLVGGLHYLFCKSGVENAADLADQFVLLLASGDGLDKAHPVQKLRNLLLKNRSAQKKHNRKALIGLTIKAWDAFAAGVQEIKRLEIRDNETPYVGGLDAPPTVLSAESEINEEVGEDASEEGDTEQEAA